MKVPLHAFQANNYPHDFVDCSAIDGAGSLTLGLQGELGAWLTASHTVQSPLAPEVPFQVDSVTRPLRPTLSQAFCPAESLHAPQAHLACFKAASLSRSSSSC